MTKSIIVVLLANLCYEKEKGRGRGPGERGIENEKYRETERGREGKERINHWDNVYEYQRVALGSDNIFNASPMTYHI